MNYNTNSTSDERIAAYVSTGDEKKAQALSMLVGYLEDCRNWDIKLMKDEES